MVKSNPSPPGVLPKLTPVRPMVMLTGFLGAGKTTFLRSLLQNLALDDYGADVILNDRENARIDRETLRDDAKSIETLTGSCVCCEGLDQLNQLLLNASRTKHDVLLIELNGTADPIPLQETFILFEKHMQLRPRWQLCVVDARFFGKRRAFAELEKLQLETASYYYISHAEEVSKDRLQSVLKRVTRVNPHASRTTVGEFSQHVGRAISGNQGVEMSILREERDGTRLPFTQKKTPHHRHHVAHEFTGCNIVFPEAVEEVRVFEWLRALPDEIIRVKVLLKLKSDRQSRFLYERVSGEVSPAPIPVREIARVPCSGIFIGPTLDPDEILHFTQAKFAPTAHFPD